MADAIILLTEASWDSYLRLDAYFDQVLIYRKVVVRKRFVSSRAPLA
jgi:hypothetical protein